jgi:hypothetical protein
VITVVGNDPLIDTDFFVDLDASMIPVKYTGSAGAPEWQIADVSNDNRDWYDYGAQKWANAVAVVAAKRDDYASAPVGTPVAEADILAYFVYIPRYRYRVQTLNFNNRPLSPQLFEIEFENIYRPGYSKATVQHVSKVGDWLTHPAFTLDPDGNPSNNDGDEIELNGFWMGKFEMTGTIVEPTIKPGLASRAVSINDVWAATQNMADYYGISVYGTTKSYPIDMYKWGAVVYLTVSDWGYGQIMAANSSTNATGGSSSATAYSNNLTQSTTGNATGIYDMNRGAWEYVLGNFGDDGVGVVGTSGIALLDFPINIPGVQYVEFFAGTDAALRNCSFVRCAGMATFEVDGWSGNSNVTLTSSNPWLVRGGGVCPGASGSSGGVVSSALWSGAGAAVSCHHYNFDSYYWAPVGRAIESKF